MTRKMLRSLSLTLAVLASLVAFQQTAQAGPPLICHPLEIGEARSLPWSGPHWRSVKADYDLNRLVQDTLALLRPETPVIVRMETLRRATIYAVWAKVDHEVGYTVKNADVARELLSRLQARADDAKGKGPAEALALFDVGYLAECYKQADSESKNPNIAGGIDGYASVVKAIALRGGRDPEMEFAAALITIHPRRNGHLEHLQKAVTGASDNTLLARNLVSHFGDRGKTITELRANVRVAKN